MISRMSSTPVCDGGVHLDHVDVPALGDRAARLADVARRDRRTALPVRADAVERLGDQPRGRGLADAADAGEQERMRDPPALDRIGERLHHRVLADQLGKGLRAVFAGEHAIGRRASPAVAAAQGCRGPGPGDSSSSIRSRLRCHSRHCEERSKAAIESNSGLLRFAQRQETVEADDPARNRCGCFLPDLTRLATAPSADFRARHMVERRSRRCKFEAASSLTVHPCRRSSGISMRLHAPSLSCDARLGSRRSGRPRDADHRHRASVGTVHQPDGRAVPGALCNATTRSPTGSARPTAIMTAFSTVDEMHGRRRTLLRNARHQSRRSDRSGRIGAIRI